jgi:hypothetical protein
VGQHSEVTSIQILYDLPRLLTSSILAHELMHAWLKLDSKLRLSMKRVLARKFLTPFGMWCSKHDLEVVLHMWLACLRF